jgi:L-amino acid N-acyltransferase YncA
MRIEDARDDDLPAILAIYNDVLRTSTAIYREEPATLEERQAWNEARKKNGYPLLVARTDDAPVAGFATFGDFRAWPGARGSALGKHVMVAGIDADNGGSIRMHERLGFEQTGHLKEVGWKFGRWLDLVFMQRRL